MEEKSIALIMLEELKKSSKRWFIISMILIILLVVTNICWLKYISNTRVSSEEQTIQTIEDSDLDNTDVIQY